MNDDLLTALRADLDAFVGEPGPPPAVPQLPVARIGDRPARPLLALGAAAATIAVVVTGLALIARRDDPDVGDTPLPVPTTPDATTPVMTMPVPPTPDGWTVVESGDLRVSLSPDMDPFAGACTTTPDTDAASVAIACGARTLTIGSVGVDGLDSTGATTRNGLTMQLTPVPDLGTATQLLVADTQSLVRFEGFDSDDVTAIVDTVGVSSKWRALNEPAPPVPDDWQTVTAPGVTVRVPQDWPIEELGRDEQRPGSCGFAGMTGGVTLALGVTEVAAPCPAAPPALAPPTDGVWLYELGPDETVSIADEHPVVDRYLSVDGHRYLVRVGFGVDGTVGRTILGSISGPDAPAPTVTTAPTTEPPVTAPLTVPTTTTPVTVPIPEYEAIGTVIDAGAGEPILCSATLESLPPQCAGGVPLDGWSWDVVEGELDQAGTTWLDGVWVTGLYDASTSASLTVTEAHPATAADRERITGTPAPEPDFSVPCAEPPEGWPARNAEWPAEQIEAIPGFAGAWPDVTQQVVTVRFTGDLDAAREAITQHYPDAICLVAANHSAQELSQIATELLSMSSVHVFNTVEMVDATGEWVDATIATPNPALQAALDERYGEGTVRLRSYLLPVPAL